MQLAENYHHGKLTGENWKENKKQELQAVKLLASKD